MQLDQEIDIQWADLAPRIGSALRADRATILTPGVGAAIRAVLEQRGVVVIRQVHLTDEQQLAFTENLGPIAEKVFKISLDKRVNPIAEYTRGAFFWHIDGTTSQVPIFASIMSARALSETGGQTEFANTYAAYDDLSQPEQQVLESLRVVHTLEAAQRYVNPEPTSAELQAWQSFPPNVLPLVWNHKSGRKSLVLGSTASHVEGMSIGESGALLTRLREHATQPQFVYRHEWSLGDLLMWDNTGTMHRAISYPLDSGRLMHRTTIKGDEPFA